MSMMLLKVFSMVALGLVTWIIGLLPLIGVKKGWLQNIEQTPRRLLLYSLLLCFGGGVILTSCLTHMLPHVREVYETAVDKGAFPDDGLETPEILVLAGFLLIYLIEEVAHALLQKFGLLHSSDDESNEKGHGHSHEFHIASESSIQATARGFLVILALCIHDLFEGIAIGVSRQESSIWFLLLAFVSHKWVIAGCLGLKWSRSALKTVISILYMSLFCLVSPVGIMIGMLLTSPEQESDMVSSALVVLQGIATGSLLYVVFFEILEKERQKNVSGVFQAMAFSAGFLFMVVCGLAEVQSHAEEGSLALNVTNLNATKALI